MHRGKLKVLGRRYGGTPIERVLSQAGTQMRNGCIPWLGRPTKAGYPAFSHNMKRIYAHRVVAANKYGPLRRGQVVCHSCDHPWCINPDHLFVGTQKDNLNDCVKKRRHAFGAKNGHAKLTDEMVISATELYHGGLSQKSIAKKFNVCQQTISDAVRRRLWKHVG